MSVCKSSPWSYGIGGLIAGLAFVFTAGAGEHTGGRYVLRVWTTPPGQATNPDHGAYRIDTETGDVWSISSNNQSDQKIPAK